MDMLQQPACFGQEAVKECWALHTQYIACNTGESNVKDDVLRHPAFSDPEFSLAQSFVSLSQLLTLCHFICKTGKYFMCPQRGVIRLSNLTPLDIKSKQKARRIISIM